MFEERSGHVRQCLLGADVARPLVSVTEQRESDARQLGDNVAALGNRADVLTPRTHQLVTLGGRVTGALAHRPEQTHRGAQMVQHDGGVRVLARQSPHVA